MNSSHRHTAQGLNTTVLELPHIALLVCGICDNHIKV